MYQDIIMKLQQNQHPGAAPPRPPGANPVANLLGAAAAGTGLPNSPSILHQLQQFRDAARRPFAGLDAKDKERESPQSSGQSSSNISTQLNLVKSSNTTPDSKARRSDQKEQHKCPKCDYTTPWKSSIATHMKLKHSNERPWRCEICGKAYKLKHHLKAHMEGSHASEKPYQCKLCVFSCIDSRTLNKHMFNKHGRQTPLKAPGVMGRSPSSLGSMLPMLSRGHPMTAPPSRPDQAPQLPFNAAWGHAAAMQRANLLRAAAMQQAQQSQQPNQPGQLPMPQPPTLEQIQHLQEQLINNQLKQPERKEEGTGGSNTALLAHLAAQMQRHREAELQRLQSMAQAVNNAQSQINSSTGQSLNTTPEDEDHHVIEGVEEAKSETGSGAKVEEIEDEKTEQQNTITIEPTSPQSSPRNDQPMEASTPTQNENIKKESQATPPASSPIKVPSEHDQSDSESTKLSRKRKHEQPLDYSINEALLQQRLALQQQQQHQLPTSRQLPFPYQMPQFSRRLSNGSSDDQNRPIHPSLNNHMALALQRMQSACPPELVNHLSQMQAASLMFPKPPTVQSGSPPTPPPAPQVPAPVVPQNNDVTMTTTGTEAEKQLSCDHCQVVYPNEELLNLHNEMHETANDQPFECAQCSKVCSNAVEFFLHFRHNEHQKPSSPSQPPQTTVTEETTITEEPAGQ